jgi:hypothetical protein
MYIYFISIIYVCYYVIYHISSSFIIKASFYLFTTKILTKLI